MEHQYGFRIFNEDVHLKSEQLIYDCQTTIATFHVIQQHSRKRGWRRAKALFGLLVMTCCAVLCAAFQFENIPCSLCINRSTPLLLGMVIIDELSLISMKHTSVCSALIGNISSASLNILRNVMANHTNEKRKKKLALITNGCVCLIYLIK